MGTKKHSHKCAMTAGFVERDASSSVDAAWRALHLSAPARRALVSVGYIQLEQLHGVSRRFIASLHGMGPTAMRILIDELAEKGQTFAE